MSGSKPLSQRVVQQNLNVAKSLPEGASELTVPAVKFDGGSEVTAVPLSRKLDSRSALIAIWSRTANTMSTGGGRGARALG